MRSGLCRALIVLFSTLVFGSFFLCVQGLQAQDSDTELESATRLIVMIDGELGAGIIFGWDKERIYIATANHVVRSGSQEAQSPQIRLKALPDKSFKATLLKHADRELDLAVLSMEWPDNEKVDPFPLRIDRLSRIAMKRGDPVYAVGNPNGVPWGMSVAPDRVAQIVGVQVTFQSAFISKGHSGGGLLNGQGEVVGMIRADQLPFGLATNIENILQALEAWGYPVKLRVANSPSPLFLASEKGSVNEVKQSLGERCPEVNMRHDGMTPLLIAAENGYVDIVKLLIDAGADLEAKSEVHAETFALEFGRDKQTPLALAVKQGHREIARFLIKAGAKTDFAKKADTLGDAASEGRVESVKLLLEIGANIEQGNSSGRTPLFLAVTGRKIEVVKVLLDAGADVNRSGGVAQNPLYWAISQDPTDRIEIIKLLVKAKTNIDQRFEDPNGRSTNENGHTPLTLAVSRGQVELVKILLEAGANVNGADDDGRTALHYAAEFDNVGVGEEYADALAIRLALLQLLLQAGANVNAKDKYGDPPLCRALSSIPANRKIKTAEILVKAGSVRIWPEECKSQGSRWYREELDPLIELYGVK